MVDILVLRWNYLQIPSKNGKTSNNWCLAGLVLDSCRSKTHFIIVHILNCSSEGSSVQKEN